MFYHPTLQGICLDRETQHGTYLECAGGTNTKLLWLHPGASTWAQSLRSSFGLWLPFHGRTGRWSSRPILLFLQLLLFLPQLRLDVTDDRPGSILASIEVGSDHSPIGYVLEIYIIYTVHILYISFNWYSASSNRYGTSTCKLKYVFLCGVQRSTASASGNMMAQLELRGRILGFQLFV